MKIQVEHGGERKDLEIRRDGDTVFAAVDGREYELEVSEPEPGVFLFKNDGVVNEAFASPPPDVSQPFQIMLDGSAFEYRIIDPKRLRGSASGSDQQHGAAEIRTAMPGKVVRIILRPGAEVAKGDGVLVVEAMKMQNELKAPRAGIVKEILAEEGTTVAAGQVLATIE